MINSAGQSLETNNWSLGSLSRKQGLAVLSALAIVAIAAVANLISRYSQTEPATPYAYASPSIAADPAAIELAPFVDGTTAKVYELRIPDVPQALVTVQVLERHDGAGIVVGWESHVSQPVLRSDIFPSEDLALVSALRKHLPQGSTVLAMPALSNRLSNVIDARLPLAGHELNQGLLVPGQWQANTAGVAVLESTWRQPKRTDSDPETWNLFAQALLAEDAFGVAKLLEISSAEEAYLVLHARDIFDLGANESTPITVGMKDFAGAEHAHDVTQRVKDWSAAHGYVAHAVTRLPDGRIRAYYLNDVKHKSTLIAQLLPFDSSRIGLIPGSRLVFQAGGYWVYRLPGLLQTDA